MSKLNTSSGIRAVSHQKHTLGRTKPTGQESDMSRHWDRRAQSELTYLSKIAQHHWPAVAPAEALNMLLIDAGVETDPAGAEKLETKARRMANPVPVVEPVVEAARVRKATIAKAEAKAAAARALIPRRIPGSKVQDPVAAAARQAIAKEFDAACAEAKRIELETVTLDQGSVAPEAAPAMVMAGQGVEPPGPPLAAAFEWSDALRFSMMFAGPLRPARRRMGA